MNKWLSEQAALLPEAAGLGADFLPRRRRPRVDPTLLDWKKLTGEENVSVINRLTQKKVRLLFVERKWEFTGFVLAFLCTSLRWARANFFQFFCS